MPFQASRRHQSWTVDVRYLDMHQFGGGMIYCVSILENFSRAILASAVSRTQDLTAYLMVLYAAIRQHGSPAALVSDGGGIFKANEAMRICAALSIKKEQIDKKQAWQSYIETHFNVQRRMADWHFAHAETWTELVATHDRFVADYNFQVHWAHRDRQDDRHSPAEVLGWVQGTQRDPAELHRIFYATRFGRRVDKLGYVRFRHWRIYGEHGLARRQAAVWLYGETLLLEFSDEPLAQYSVAYELDHRHLREVVPRQLFDTQYQSPQLPLWELVLHSSMAAYIESRVDGGLRAASARYAALNPQLLLILPRRAACAGFLTRNEECSIRRWRMAQGDTSLDPTKTGVTLARPLPTRARSVARYRSGSLLTAHSSRLCRPLQDRLVGRRVGHCIGRAIGPPDAARDGQERENGTGHGKAHSHHERAVEALHQRV
jgi:hypothetical protein